MTRRPPAIVSVAPNSAGGIEVSWEVDSFFADSAEPEKVLVELNGIAFDELDGDDTSIEIPGSAIASLNVQILVVGIIFWWSGSPPEEQQSVVSVPVTSAGGGGGVVPAAKPVVTVVEVHQRTASAPSRITIAWKSNNYNDGNIIWGPTTAPTAFSRNIRPQGENYSGTFATDQPLVPATLYQFKVEVRNTLQSPTWISTTIFVRSPEETLSVRAFLIASGTPTTTPLSGVVGPSRSVHKAVVG